MRVVSLLVTALSSFCFQRAAPAGLHEFCKQQGSFGRGAALLHTLQLKMEGGPETSHLPEEIPAWTRQPGAVTQGTWLRLNELPQSHLGNGIIALTLPSGCENSSDDQYGYPMLETQDKHLIFFFLACGINLFLFMIK